jgi:hypothetical protein
LGKRVIHCSLWQANDPSELDKKKDEIPVMIGGATSACLAWKLRLFCQNGNYMNDASKLQQLNLWIPKPEKIYARSDIHAITMGLLNRSRLKFLTDNPPCKISTN